MGRTTASRLSKIKYVKKAYREVLERRGEVSKTKIAKLNAKAAELETFADNETEIGQLAGGMASIARAVALWAKSKDDSELDGIAAKIKAVDRLLTKG